MPSAKRDMRDALKNRVVLAERPQIVEVPGERDMPGAKMIAIWTHRAESGTAAQAIRPGGT